jgi:dTDP-4-dehydrorhamnose reductase
LYGTYHLGSRRIFARDELARVIATASGHDPALVQSIKIADLKFSEPRPHHNTLDCSKIENALGFQFTEVADGIQELISKLTPSQGNHFPKANLP